MSKDKKQKVDSGVRTFYIVAVLVALAITYMFIWMAIPKDVASISGNVVDGYEFRYYLSQYVQKALEDKSPYMDTQRYLYEDTGYGSLMDSLKQQALSDSLKIEMLLIMAKEENFKVDRKVLNDEWKTHKENLTEEARKSSMSTSEYVKNYYGVSLRRAEKIYKNYILAQKYMETKLDEIPVDEEELTSYYENNKYYFDSAVVRHILISCEENANTETVEEKKQLAEDLLNKVNLGEDFAQLAEQYSEDPGSKDNGGMYEVRYGQMVKEFEDWTFSHKPGDTGIIRTSFGFHVMKLDSIKNTIDAHRDELEEIYKNGQFQQKLSEAMYSDEYEIKVLSGFEKVY